MHPLSAGLQPLFYIKNFSENHIFKQNHLGYVIQPYIYSSTNSYEYISWHEQNSKHYKIPGKELFQDSRCLQTTLKQLKKEIFALWSLFLICLSIRLYSTLCLPAGPQEVSSSVCYQISCSCVQPCEGCISSGWPNQDLGTAQQKLVLIVSCWPWLTLDLFLSTTSRKWINKYKLETLPLQHWFCLDFLMEE